MGKFLERRWSLNLAHTISEEDTHFLNSFSLWRTDNFLVLKTLSSLEMSKVAKVSVIFLSTSHMWKEFWMTSHQLQALYLKNHFIPMHSQVLLLYRNYKQCCLALVIPNGGHLKYKISLIRRFAGISITFQRTREGLSYLDQFIKGLSAMYLTEISLSTMYMYFSFTR